MQITIRKATVQDAHYITKTRQTVWQQTYRGIYPDAKLDCYDYAHYFAKDSALLSCDAHHYFLFMDGEKCVGYFSYGPYDYGTYKDFTLCLNNLYVLDGYKGRGLGKAAFAQLRLFAQQMGINKFFCGCNFHNLPAQGFYRHMGGIVGNICTGHDDKSDDIIHFEFTTGD